MEELELLEIINRGEDGKHQFKDNVTNETSLAQEMVAFSNCGGGELFIGVTDDGAIAGLNLQDIGRLNQLVSNAASQQVRPPINPTTENLSTPNGLVMRVVIPDGVSPPYMDKDGVIWVKSGADKRKATSREEMQRLFQRAGLVHGDEVLAPGLTIADLDIGYFKDFLQRNSLDDPALPLPALLEHMNLMKDGVFNVSGALLFAKNPSLRLPAFIVKAIAFPGAKFHETDYLDSRDITGKIADIFAQSLGFVLGNIRHVQGDQGVNASGRPELPRIALEEIIANALIHRDYFISAPVKVFVFSDRVEIISPGHLPNNLTVENIKRGNSNMRNPILASHATKILPYRGIGSGIIRALRAHPDIDLEDDRAGNRFIVTIWRKND
uniref:ATP-dependent DNA helicase RecG n=1 Tax=Candidatus Kentrum sp. MB TaxID=2138164 RepID=A0A450XZC8_9GAMM|nr:MAG: ATP-dependent DNA helicase RecG [Candidatus Kentron sp. MB]VFK34659.1 MAG: ATP-dependent DNA helicase RecG [Candidatus Kentron sp. MB]VFK76819.1 MAG: ATP-dependent DNA helicase RecG [Candidatus Kentron sp. MB]